jgi:hypothetical protein
MNDLQWLESRVNYYSDNRDEELSEMFKQLLHLYEMESLLDMIEE